ncbi:MAG TPA: NAD(P)(+) transhydrogenase (Re/Si-specific) subunit beta, partial [Clostridia bacterium]|nr:NAD(P)(+) transhydrogenase (Re/Si-specific) subunit beta [Clostridia bacterium]
MNPAQYIIEATYLIASVCFILGLKKMSHPDSARQGMFLAEFGMLAAIVGTLMHAEIVTYTWIIAGLAIGSVIGALMAIWVPMTAMPQRTALSHAFGAAAAALVGIAEYMNRGTEMPKYMLGALGFEVILGALTTTGSLIAAGKLQGVVRGTPIQFKGQQIVNLGMFVIMIGAFIYLMMNPSVTLAFWLMAAVAFVFGVALVIPIGAADMPVVMSLLNSYAGLAAAATGFVLSNNVLIIAGTLDGFSGFILSVLMCRAMNRSITNVLFGGFGAAVAAESGASGVMREINLEDAAVQLAYAKRVVFVPGYGLATAQAQHAVRELATLLEERGVEVKYAIHPVAGRMPGHMNVLLAEANVPYSLLYEMEQINPEMSATDVA